MSSLNRKRVYLRDDQVEFLENRSEVLQKSQTQIVRDAIDAYIEAQSVDHHQEEE